MYYQKAKNALQEIESAINNYESAIEFLKKENKKLQDENYKDEELKKLKEQIVGLMEDRKYSILLSKDEREHMDEILKNHLKTAHHEHKLRKGAVGGNTLEVFETSIGDWIGVKCPICEKIFEVVNRIGE